MSFVSCDDYDSCWTFGDAPYLYPSLYISLGCKVVVVVAVAVVGDGGGGGGHKVMVAAVVVVWCH